MEKMHELRFCPQCGNKLDGDEYICPSCGIALMQASPNVNEKIIQDTPAHTSAPESSKPLEYETSEVFHKRHDLFFCPKCGHKLEGDEIRCPNCDNILMEETQKKTTTEQPALFGSALTDNTQQIINKPPVNKAKPGKYEKKSRTGFYVFLIILLVLITGAGTVAFLQYNGNISLSFLETIIPQKSTEYTASSESTTTPLAVHTSYYICHSFAAVGTKMTAVISGSIVSQQPYNNKDGAILAFKKALLQKHPKIYSNFSTILCSQYKNLPDAVNYRSSLIKSYDAKKYEIKTLDVKY